MYCIKSACPFFSWFTEVKFPFRSLRFSVPPNQIIPAIPTKNNLRFDADFEGRTFAPQLPNGFKHYEIFGPLFFGSVTAFQEKFDVQNDPEHVVLDFKESRVVDHSAIDAIHKITDRYARIGKTLHLRHLSEDCRKLLDNAAALIEVNYYEDPTYRLAS